jgi:radical SAM superfamily enzyme YgiQ (UPF0313 family)
MHVLLIKPAVKGTVPNCFPLNLAYIARVLLDNNHKISVIDIDGEKLSYRTIFQRMSKIDFDIIGITGIVVHYKFLKQLTRDIKKKYPAKKIIVGGGVASPIPKLFLEKSAADIVVIGEGEVTVVELVKALESGGNLNNVKGIAYKKNRKVIITSPREPIQNLDSIPFPAWDLFPIKNYIIYCGVGYEAERSANMITSRGCPFRCIYCYDTFGKKIRYRSADNVVSEMKELKKRYNIHRLSFYDETFIADRKRALEICNKMIEEKLNLVWDCNGRANLVDEELLTLMKRAGCTHIEYGIESGSQQILDRMRKGVTVEQAKNAVRLARGVGLEVITPIMIGTPGETRKTIAETIAFFKEMGIVANCFYTTPNPGTPLYEEMRACGKIIDEDKYMDSLEEGYCDIRLNMTSFSDAELRRLKEHVERMVLINYLIKNWHSIPKIIFSRYKSMGFKGFIKHVYGYLKSYSFLKQKKKVNQ